MKKLNQLYFKELINQKAADLEVVICEKSNKYNIYCIVEARTSSTRLPNKVLKNLSSKDKVIDFVIQNLINSKIEKKNNFGFTKK